MSIHPGVLEIFLFYALSVVTLEYEEVVYFVTWIAVILKCRNKHFRKKYNKYFIGFLFLFILEAWDLNVAQVTPVSTTFIFVSRNAYTKNRIN